MQQNCSVPNSGSVRSSLCTIKGLLVRVRGYGVASLAGGALASLAERQSYGTRSKVHGVRGRQSGICSAAER